jgi:thiol-disulfide isomerase/thioredoxin
MGRLLPPVDIRDESQLNELSKRILKGPLTLVLVYADWCGHCQRFKPMMEQLENIPERSIQTARIRDDVFPKSPLASAKIEGYPTLMLVEKNGKVASFQSKNGEVTNAVPDHTDMEKMTAIVRTAGRPEAENLLEESTISMQPPSLSQTANATVNTTVPSPTIPKNIIADRLSVNSVNRLNSTLVNSNNTLLKETAKPMKGGLRGGSLWSQLAVAAQDLAPAATLFLGAQALRKRSRRTRKISKRAKRKSSRKMK